jgi:two-component system response regulator RstA
VARIDAVLRRRGSDDDEILRAGAVEVSASTRSARLNGKDLVLTSAEFELLWLLVRNQGRVLTRDRIMDETRGIDWAAYDRAIDVLVSRLRQKLGDEAKRPTLIRTVRGTGYIFIGSKRG